MLGVLVAAILTACTSVDDRVARPPGSDAPSLGVGRSGGGVVRLYTSVTQATVDAVVSGFRAQAAGTEVEVFRAPTGELAARIAAEQREGGLRADVLWLTDPLSMEEYDSQGLLAAWQPTEAEGIPAEYRSERYWGTRLLNMVIVAAADAEPLPADWSDLAEPAYQGTVAIPDPAFAGSAFGALGYLAQADGYGFDLYRALRANGAVQVQAPDEVVTGVAEGRYEAGMTLDFSVRTALSNGSPVQLIWPSSGAIAIYSPIAVVAAERDRSAAQAFTGFTLSAAGQGLIAGTGWQPTRSGVSGGPEPAGDQVSPAWAAAAAERDELIAEYQAIFGE